MNQQDFRAAVLNSLGASSSEREELLAYNQNFFDHSNLKHDLNLPLPDEPFVVAWEQYVREALHKGVFETLIKRLVQLRFAIREGISQTEFYQSATLRGKLPDEIPEATGLSLKRPEVLQLTLHQGPAGRIPVLVTSEREDFIALVRALAMKNEPGPVPESMGASTISGLNNWDRIRRLREEWQAGHSEDAMGLGWSQEFRRIIVQKELYQDRLIILSEGPYSGVSSDQLGFSEAEWTPISLTIRREHEYAHYSTKRLFASMKNRLMDEILADYMGITAAATRYRAEWFLRFVGLENFPFYREGGRLENYRGEPSLSDGAFKILQSLVKRAAENLQLFDGQVRGEGDSPRSRFKELIGLTYLTLEELASEEALFLLKDAMKRAGILFSETATVGQG
jgi:hypothetical protein